METSIKKTKALTEKTFLNRTFAIAAVGFFAIFTIGIITNFVIDSSGILRNELNGTGSYNFSMYRSVQLSSAVARLARVSMAAIGLILLSGIINLIWVFRILKASKGFIYFAFSLYVFAQGLGFGLLFVTWKATDLIAIFAISGTMFTAMSLIGYTTKRNLLPLGRWLMYGSLVAIGIMFVNMILYFTGFYTNILNLGLSAFIAFLILGWIAYEVWSIKKTSQYAASIGGFDSMTNFRLTMFMGFRLLANLVALVWYTARFYRYFAK